MGRKNIARRRDPLSNVNVSGGTDKSRHRKSGPVSRVLNKNNIGVHACKARYQKSDISSRTSVRPSVFKSRKTRVRTTPCAQECVGQTADSSASQRSVGDPEKQRRVRWADGQTNGGSKNGGLSNGGSSEASAGLIAGTHDGSRSVSRRSSDAVAGRSRGYSANGNPGKSGGTNGIGWRPAMVAH